MTNLAAAVELKDLNTDFLRESVALLRKHGPEFKIDPYKFADIIEELLSSRETILAELGRGAGEPACRTCNGIGMIGNASIYDGENCPNCTPVANVHDFDGNIGVILRSDAILKGGDKLYLHPPVAGLAELTDAGLFALFDVMDIAWVCATSPAEGRKDVAKAAREFLGKVDG